MKTFILKILIATSILAIALTACNLPIGGNTGVNATQTQAALDAAVSVRLTQIAFDALVAQMTQQALVSPTPAATNTPLPTATVYIPPATPIPPTATAIPIPCYRGSFIEDVTVKDGTSFIAGTLFTKTWRIKNTGSCAWTKDFKIYFHSGNSMGAAASVAFPAAVNPGGTVDLSVAMTAPSSTGDFTGNWMLKAANGTVFGVGTNANAALTVVIKVTGVPASKDPNTIYDFVKNYCSAQWRTNAGFITCPSTGIDFKNGSITRTYAPVLEGGWVDDEGALQTVPATGGDGMIQGQFPAMMIHSGDKFVSTLICSHKMTACSVTFELSYKEKGSDTRTVLGSWDKTYDGTTLPVNVDLSALDGKEIIFFLKVISKGDSTNDLAQWMAARITHP